MSRRDAHADLCKRARHFPIFAAVDEDDFAELAALAICHDYPKNNILFYQSDPAESVYLVLDGRVKITLMNEEGKEVVLAIAQPGGLFGLVSAFDGGPHPANAITAEPSRLAKFDRAAFARWLERHPGMQQTLLSELAARIRQLYAKVGEHALLGVRERLLFTLLEIAEREGERMPGGQTIVFTRPTHQELANRIGSSREVVSRLLKDLLDSELLQAEGRIIRVPESALVLREI